MKARVMCGIESGDAISIRESGDAISNLFFPPSMVKLLFSFKLQLFAQLETLGMAHMQLYEIQTILTISFLFIQIHTVFS